MAIDNITRRHSLGMFVVGGIVWLSFLAYTNALAVSGINHLVVEASGMPLTLALNYSLNSRFNFRQPMRWRSFGLFCVISSVGWVSFFSTTLVMVDFFSVSARISQVMAILTMTIINVIFQQTVTFRRRLPSRQS